jgi:Cof subfamily protein (haloacid dehalogenase superfamily)
LNSTNILPQIIFSDLDGTLLPGQSEISNQDMNTLHKLGERNIIRVIATGRNFLSAQKALKSDFPIDYLIFSSGLGIYDWKNRKLLFSSGIKINESKNIAKNLINNKFNFMVLDSIPNNHKFSYYICKDTCTDFDSRLKIYSKYSRELTNIEQLDDCSQFLVIDSYEENRHKLIEKILPDFKLIRATSPIDHNSVWSEVFPKNISKATGCQYICNLLSINNENCVCIGNDYNDIDMLNWCSNSWIVENSPEFLKTKYNITDSVYNSGFTKLFSNYI